MSVPAAVFASLVPTPGPLGIAAAKLEVFIGHQTAMQSKAAAFPSHHIHDVLGHFTRGQPGARRKSGIELDEFLEQARFPNSAGHVDQPVWGCPEAVPGFGDTQAPRAYRSRAAARAPRLASKAAPAIHDNRRKASRAADR